MNIHSVKERDVYQEASRPRGPGFFFVVIALVLVVLLGIFALTSRQPPPPTIAEFAPQAVENITDAPNDQSSHSGRSGGAGQGAGGEVTPTPAPSVAPVTVARVRRCVGDPPRQIEDPQSPPCVPYWSGDNGGATSRGVTRDEVIIANPGGRIGEPIQSDLQNFFNKRFEFYGRKLRFVAVADQGGDNSCCDSELDQSSSAVYVDEQVKAFASTLWDFEGNSKFTSELARRHVVTAVSPEFNWETEALNKMAPYAWQYPMAADVMMENLGEWMCKRLWGRPASHAGPAYATTTRTFGLVLRTSNYDPRLSLEPYKRSLGACGGSFKTVLDYSGSTADDNTEAANTALKLRTDGITTAQCLCPYFSFPKNLWQQSSSQQYSPEWIVSSLGSHATTFSFNWAAPVPDQAEHAFGLAFEPREVTADQEPYVWALRETDPGYNTAADVGQLRKRNYYHSVLILASGIQMAGPRLTPQTFEAGLQKAVFPNPEHPNRPGHVGFNNGSHSMTRDGAEFWWSNTAIAKWPNPHDAGSVCYVNDGARHRKGSWPSDGDPFFRPPC